jgi:hypothetical protein
MSILKYFNSLKVTHSSLYNELEQELPKLNLNPESFFDYTKNLTDPFQEITTNPDTDNSILNHLYNWYKSINPYYELLDTLNPNIPEFNKIQPYRTLLLNMAKDLIILKSTEKFPKPNIPQITNNNKNNRRAMNTIHTEGSQSKAYRTKNFTATHTENSRGLKDLESLTDVMKSMIIDLLNLINSVLNESSINTYYKYLSIIEIIDKYLLLFSFGKEVSKHQHRESLLKTINTPFIIYPTFNPISYTKVIYFMQAPVLNFMIMNTRKIVHSKYELPYYQVQHDINAHSKMTHSYGLEIKFSIFTKINKIIGLFKKYINYDIKYFKSNTNTNTNTNNEKKLYNININKFILCYIFFIICHENIYLLANQEHIGLLFFSSSIDEMIEMIKSYSSCDNYDILKDIEETFPYSDHIVEKFNMMIKHNNNKQTEKTKICSLAIEQLNSIRDRDGLDASIELINQEHKISNQIKANGEAMEEKYRTQTKKPTNLSPPNYLKNVHPHKLKYFKTLGIPKTHKGGKNPNTHHKQTKKKSNRKTTNKSNITNLLKKHILSKINQKIK